MKFSHRLLVLAAAGAFAPFMLHAAPDALAAGTAITNPGSAPRDVTLPDGTFVRLGANASGEINAAGELVLEKGSAVIIAKDGAPVTLVTGGTRTTVTGGTCIVSATKDSGLRVIALAGDAIVAAAGAEPVELDPGQTTVVFHAKSGEAPTTSPVITVDLGAIAKSSRLLNSAPLPSAGELGEALADQRESLASGDLSPTGRLVVAASRERGLGFASAGDVQNALSLRGTALKTENEILVRSIVAQVANTLANNPNNPAGNTLATTTINIGGVETPAIVDTATGQVGIGEGSSIQTSGGTLALNKGAANGVVMVSPGSGNQLISSGNTYTGTININGGTLNAGSFGTGLSSGTFTHNGGTLTTPTPTTPVTLSTPVTPTTPRYMFDGNTVYIVDGSTFDPYDSPTIRIRNTTFAATTAPVGTTGGIISFAPGGPGTLVDLEAVTVVPIHTLRVNAHTVNLKNVTFDQGRLLSRDGVLNVGSVVDGAVNFVSGVKTSDNTDLTTAGGINAKVQVVPGTILQNGTPMAGATGAGAGAPIVIDRR